MGSPLYDFLTESFLFGEAHFRESYRRFSDDELLRELSRYREFALNTLPVLSSELVASESNLRVFHPDSAAPLPLLKQTSLYVEQFVLADPLFELTHQEGKVGATMNQFLGFPEKRLSRERIVKAIGFLKEATPLVAGNFLKLLPTSFFAEPPAEIPIYYSENNYEDGIPAPILDYFKSQSRVSSLKKIAGYWALENDLYPCRAISVELPGYDGGRIYHLMEQKILSSRKDGDKTLVTFSQHLPDTPPSQEQFAVWVSQSVNRTAKSVLTETMRDVHFAADHSAMLLTSSAFKSELLKKNFTIESSIQSSALNSLFKLELPFLDGVSAESIMEVRANDGEAFQNFRVELEKHFRELRLVKDPDQLRVKQENLVHELSEVQVRQVGQKIGSLRKKLFTEATVLAAGLFGTVQTGGWSLLASGAAAAKGYQTVQDYLQNTRQSPAFFLWKILNKKD